MKFIHIADLHFGKTLHDFPLVREDQPYFAEGFIELCAEEKPDAVVIAGDVYDRGTPSAEAVALLDSFLTRINSLGIPVLMVAGNHDSGKKLEFGGSILEKEKLYIAGTLGDGGNVRLKKVTLTDEYGEADFWLMPYIVPAVIAARLDKPELRDYDEAVSALLAVQDIDYSRRNVIVAHQNVVDGEGEYGNIKGGSETMLGGVGGMNYTVFDGFTYAALGHIHAAQSVGRECVRYAGSPLCYHFSETRQSVKGPVIVTLGENGTEPELEIRTLKPLHPMREIRGRYADIIDAERTNGVGGEYVRVVLDGEFVTHTVASELRACFEAKGSLLLSLESENRELHRYASSVGRRAEMTTADIFTSFYTETKGREPDDFTASVIEYLEEHGRNDSGDASDDEAERFVRFLRES